MVSTYDEARLAGGGRASELDHAGQQFHSEDSAAALKRQRLTEALVALDSIRLRALIARDNLRAVGLDDEDDIAGAATAKIVALRLILAGRADLADLPRSWPAHASRAAVSYRAERDRRRR